MMCTLYNKAICLRSRHLDNTDEHYDNVEFRDLRNPKRYFQVASLLIRKNDLGREKDRNCFFNASIDLISYLLKK